MKKIILCLCCISALFLVQCAPKVGCPSAENLSANMDKKGNLKGKGGKTQLFDKNMRKSMGKG